MSLERAIAAIAEEQHGLITRTQLLSLGLGPGAIQHRLRTGRLRRIHRGVYRVSGAAPIKPPARALAAVLACGPRAVASHRTAAGLWQLTEIDEQEAVHVTVLRSGPGHRPGIRVHRPRSLAEDEVATVTGVPVTSPSRTILDLAGTLPSRQLEQMYALAVRRRLVGPSRLLQLLPRRAGRHGTPRLRHLLEAECSPALTHSEAEERFLALIRAAGLPEPETNVLLGRYKVDFLWREQRLIVEIDGFAFHGSRTSFEGDRRRDADLHTAGWRVVRFTWRQLTTERERVIATLAALLTRA